MSKQFQTGSFEMIDSLKHLMSSLQDFKTNFKIWVCKLNYERS